MAIETAKDRQTRESIEALTRQLEEERAERERFENLFAATCETLGRVKRALGMPDAAIGTEPEQAAALREERDALAAHVERLRLVAENMDYFNDSIDLGDAEIAASDAGDTLDEILARRDARMKAEAWDECAQGLGGMDQELAEIRAGKYRDQSREVS